MGKVTDRVVVEVATLCGYGRVFRRHSHCHKLARLGGIHVFPRLGDGLKQALYLGCIVGRTVDVYIRCEQLADSVAV